METKFILAISLIAVLLVSVISFDDVFAKEHKEPKPPKEPKTLESECAKKKPNSFDGLFCEAIINIQIMLDMIKADILQLRIDLDNIENTPGPEGPKPTELTILYTSDPIAAIDTTFTVTDTNDDPVNNAYKTNPDPVIVSDGETFTVSPKAGDSELKNRVAFYIGTTQFDFDHKGDGKEIHTSCSEPLFPGLTASVTDDGVTHTLTLESWKYSGDNANCLPQTRSVVIFPVEFASTFDVDWLVPLKGAAGVIKSTSTKSFLFASIPQLPDGATITRLDCRVFDNDGVEDLECAIVRKSFESDVGVVIADVGTSGASASNQDISDTSIKPGTEVVDRDTFGYVVRYDAPPACDESCKLFSAKVTYTIDKVE